MVAPFVLLLPSIFKTDPLLKNAKRSSFVDTFLWWTADKYMCFLWSLAIIVFYTYKLYVYIIFATSCAKKLSVRIYFQHKLLLMITPGGLESGSMSMLLTPLENSCTSFTGLLLRNRCLERCCLSLCLNSLTVCQFHSAVFQCANNPWNSCEITAVISRT